MPDTVSYVMTPRPVCVPTDATLVHAAERMRDHNIGDVLVVSGDVLRGIVTDRDLVVRGLALHADPLATTVGTVCTTSPAVLDPDQPVETAVAMMRDLGVRRLPVCDARGVPIGILSLGDLAVEHDPDSALADISAAPPTV
ncbi:CBS domain-containing protein [Longispora sp. K20-0274]|uniref:CBS domain-containing protein n=1 Tax=Longispora sp. K20-0274 TaxID=3088255 RepID=UPI003999A9D0